MYPTQHNNFKRYKDSYSLLLEWLSSRAQKITNVDKDLGWGGGGEGILMFCW
jgi:hypothetical protein